MANEKIRELASLVRGVLLTSAIGVGANYEPFNQYLTGYQEGYDKWIGRGLCHGISMLFLGVEKNFGDIRHDFNRFTMEHNFKTDVHNEIFSNATKGNTPWSNLDDQNAHMLETYKLKFVEKKTFGNKVSLLSHSRAGSFVSAGNYFYMISSGGHAMGVVTRGKMSTFLEPNCGIVRCKPSKMSDLFSSFFGHDFIKDKYGHGHKVVLSICKYKGV